LIKKLFEATFVTLKITIDNDINLEKIFYYICVCAQERDGSNAQRDEIENNIEYLFTKFTLDVGVYIH
jgi:hypothetical protein